MALDAVIATVGAHIGLDVDLALRLVERDGLVVEDLSEIEAAVRHVAQRWPHVLKTTSETPTNPARSRSEPVEQENERRQRIWGHSATLFDPREATALGGGVAYPREQH